MSSSSPGTERHPDPTPLGAGDIALEVTAGRRTAAAVVDGALARIAAARGLRAVDVVLADEARRDARALDERIAAGGDVGPLAGVPVAIKAENDVAGVVTTFGGRANSTPAQHDSEVVRRLRAAGAIVVATTHMPEFGQFPFTEGAAWGATINPWAPARSPGGSSGGSAAAVAAGLVPVAIGGDGGGSIRIPASCCGLVGLKPVRGRVSTAPWPGLWGPLGVIGPLTRTVADTARVYDAIWGATRADRYAAPPPAESFGEARTREPGPLRIGVVTRAPWPVVRVDPRVAAVVREVASALAALGHRVTEVPGRFPDAQPAFVPLFYAALREEAGRVEHPERLEARTRSSLRSGAWAVPEVRRLAIAKADAMERAVLRRFEAYDVLLTPTIACLPPPAGRLDGAGATRALARSMPMVAFSSLANVTGHAAISVPGGLVDGLPVGVQLYGVGGDETRLLQLAAQLEAARPWPLVAPARPAP